MNNTLTNIQYWWVFLNIQEDKLEEGAKIKNIIEALHSRLRPESYKPKIDSGSSEEGEFEKLIKMGMEDELNGQNNI